MPVIIGFGTVVFDYVFNYLEDVICDMCYYTSRDVTTFRVKRTLRVGCLTPLPSPRVGSCPSVPSPTRVFLFLLVSELNIWMHHPI
jgi:hypothetical protein